MARIRSIKPDAFRSDTLSRCTVLARWTFAGLWTYADDYGKGRFNVRLIKAELFPLDDSVDLTKLSGALQELSNEGCICVYKVGPTEYFHIPKWTEHQKVSHPTDSKLPDHLTCTLEDSGEPPEILASPPEVLVPDREQGTGNREGNREKARKRATHIPDEWQPNDHHRKIAADLEVNLAAEAAKFRDYDRATGPKWRDHDAAFNNWLRNSRQFNGRQRPGPEVDWDAALARAQVRDAQGGST